MYRQRNISDILMRIINISVIRSIGIILCLFLEKIYLERDIKRKIPIWTFSQKTGQVKKECKFSHEYPHKTSIEEKRL